MVTTQQLAVKVQKLSLPTQSSNTYFTPPLTAIFFLSLTLLPMENELLPKVVFDRLNQAAIWASVVTSTPSLNLIPVIIFAR
jgi:hypothetical protein